MKRSLNSLLCLFLLNPVLLVFSDENPRLPKVKGLLYVIDVSGSMFTMLPQIKQSIETELIKNVSYTELAFGLVDFDGCGMDRVRYPVPMALANRDIMIQTISNFSAGGMTDLSAVLTFARDKIIRPYFDGTGECVPFLFFTDHIDTCTSAKGYLKILREITKMCTKQFSVDIITSVKFTEDDIKIRARIDEIAEITGGVVYEAKDVEGMRRSIQRVLQMRTRIPQAKPVRARQTEEQGQEQLEKPKEREDSKIPQKQKNRSGSGGSTKS
jgi:hypothetical protein